MKKHGYGTLKRNGKVTVSHNRNLPELPELPVRI